MARSLLDIGKHIRNLLDSTDIDDKIGRAYSSFTQPRVSPTQRFKFGLLNSPPQQPLRIARNAVNTQKNVLPNQFADIGRLFQRTPDIPIPKPTVDLPWYTPPGLNQRVGNFLLNLPSNLIRETGRAAEIGATNTPQQLWEETKKAPGQAASGDFQALFDNPAIAFGLGASNVIPGGGIVPSLTKQGVKQTAKKGAVELLEQGAKKADDIVKFVDDVSKRVGGKNVAQPALNQKIDVYSADALQGARDRLIQKGNDIVGVKKLNRRIGDIYRIEYKPNVAQERLGGAGLKMTPNLKLTDAYPKNFLGFNLQGMEKMANKKGFNLYDALVKRVDSQDKMPDKIKAMQSILDEISGSRVISQPNINPLAQEARKYKSAVYKTINEGGVIKNVEGKPIKLVDGVDTFIHQGDNPKRTVKGFVISEKSTGRYIATGETERQAIANAKNVINNVGEEKFRQTIAKSQLTDIYNQATGGKQVGVSGIKIPLGQTGETLRSQQKLAQESLRGVQQPNLKVPVTGTVNPSSPSIISQEGKYAFNINKERLGLKGKDAQKLDEVVEKMKPILQSRKGKPLTNKEIIREGRKANLLTDVMGRDEAADFAGKLQATRNFIKTASQQKGVTPEYLAQLDILSSTAADTGRRLRSFAVGAEDAGIKELILRDLQEIGVKTKQLVEASKNVDWNDAKQVTEFYRKFKPARLTERLEEFRYTNMLSSPNTHIINSFSNFLQGAVVAPVEKTVAGGIDFVLSRLTGKERQYFVGQGVDYTKGFWKKLPEAWTKFKDVTLGQGGLRKPDVDFIPTGTGKLHQIYTTPLRMLEAGDQFFRTMIEGGEIASYGRLKLTDAQKLTKAQQTAEYRIFRQQFDPNGKLGQGGVLKLWDKWNSGINRLRQLPGGKWIVPFLQTPTNILKQGVEYSPLGLATVPGSREPTVQLAKTMIGSAVFTGAYALGEAGLTTWDAPINKKERDAFYAAGLQPYSVKIGDKWVSYSKLGPLSYPIAMGAAMKWAKDNGAENNLLTISGMGIGGFLQFFADQSYVRGIGDVIDAVRGDEFKQGRSFANIPGQLIPYRSLQGWITRLVDPIYRKTTGGSIPEQALKSIFSQVPGLSQTLEPYETPLGEPSPRSHPFINAISPLRISQENPEYRRMYESVRKGALSQKQDAVIKQSIEANGGYKALSDGKIAYINAKGNVATLDLNPPTKGTGIGSFKNTDWEASKAVSIWNSEDIPKELKTEALKKLKVDPEDARYAALASYDTDISTQYLISKSPDRETLLNNIYTGRVVGITGEQFVNNGVIDNLEDEGLITDAEAKALKKLKFDKNGKNISTSSGGKGKKAIKLTLPKASPVKITFSGTRVGSGKKLPGVKLTSGPVKVKPNSNNTIKVKTPEKSISYRVVTPQKIQGLTNAIRLA